MRATALLAAALFSSACSTSVSTKQIALSVGADSRKPAPDFTLQDATGKMARLSEYKGKVVLLDFWATWCGPCKIEEPWLKEFEQTYKDRGFAVLGVSMDEEGWSVVKPYIEEKKFNFRVLLGNEQVEKLYGGMDAWPTSFVIDRSGRIVDKHVGVVSKSVFVETIQALLAEKP